MQKQLVVIVALSVDTNHAVLYLQDGSTLTMMQGDPRLSRILEQSRDKLERGEPATVDITEIIVERTEFSDAEKGSKGGIKFLRVAKAFLKKLINTESPLVPDPEFAHISPLSIGTFPGSQSKVTSASLDTKQVLTEELTAEPEKQIPSNDEKLAQARSKLHQLAGNSVGTEDPKFHKPMDENTETIVAVHTESGAIIPDAHKLSPQLKSASKLNDYQGFNNFIERLSKIIDQRGHSVEDLMKFIQTGDLPIADDGCIVIYKRLQSHGSGVYVDVHSKQIKQKIGSYVFMKPSLVDPNRRQDCSNGLHVASLSYLNAFTGDVTVIAKVRPEDVFAVPEYSHNKMRVCGYHILAVLPTKLRNLVNRGGSISSDPQGAQLLNQILRGYHTKITQHVEVGGHRGSNVTYTDVLVDSADELAQVEVEVKNETLDLTAPVQPVPEPSPTIVAKELVKTKPVAKVKPPGDTSGGKPSQKDRAEELYNTVLNGQAETAKKMAATDLLKFKKQAKKSWTAWGLPETTTELLNQMLAEPAEAVEWKPDTKKAKPKKKAEPVKPEFKPVTKKTAAKPKAKPESKREVIGYDLDAKGEAIRLIKSGDLSNMGIAKATGLSKDQVYRLRKKHG